MGIDHLAIHASIIPIAQIIELATVESPQYTNIKPLVDSASLELRFVNRPGIRLKLEVTFQFSSSNERIAHMKQYNALNVAKFLANTGIIFHHYQQITHFSFNRLLDFYYGYFYWGYLVELFFCISGFLSIHYIDRIDAGLRFGKFILNKYKRFAPTLFVSACIYSIVVFLYQIIVAPEYQVDWDHINQPIDI